MIMINYNNKVLIASLLRSLYFGFSNSLRFFDRLNLVAMSSYSDLEDQDSSGSGSDGSYKPEPEHNNKSKQKQKRKSKAKSKKSKSKTKDKSKGKDKINNKKHKSGKKGKKSKSKNKSKSSRSKKHSKSNKSGKSDKCDKLHSSNNSRKSNLLKTSKKDKRKVSQENSIKKLRHSGLKRSRIEFESDGKINISEVFGSSNVESDKNCSSNSLCKCSTPNEMAQFLQSRMNDNLASQLLPKRRAAAKKSQAADRNRTIGLASTKYNSRDES